MSAQAEVPVQQDEMVDVGLGDHFTITPQGLEVTGHPSFDACQALWNKLLTAEKVIQFAIGDAAKYIRERFGHDADQIISDRTGWTLETIRNYEWIADKVPKQVRRLDKLHFTHHQKVAAQPVRVQARLLNQAADSEERPWTVARLSQAVAAGGEDVPATRWFLVVTCASEAKRDALQKRLELDGYECKPTERRGERKAEDGEKEGRA